MCRVGLVVICFIFVYWFWLWKIWIRGYFMNYIELFVKVIILLRWNFIDCFLKNEFDVIFFWNVWKLIFIFYRIIFLDGVIFLFFVLLCFFFILFFVGVVFKGVVFEGVVLFLVGVVFMGDIFVLLLLFMFVLLLFFLLLLLLFLLLFFKGFFFGVFLLEFGMRFVVFFDFLKRVCKIIFKVSFYF